MPYYIKKIPSLKLRKLAPFDWKFLQIGTLRAKDPRKNVLILQEGGSTPVPPTPPVIRVVLLHTEQFVESLDSQTVFSKECEIYFEIKHTTIL